MPRIRMPNGSTAHFNEQLQMVTPEDGSPAYAYHLSPQYIQAYTLPDSGYWRGSLTTTYLDETVTQQDVSQAAAGLGHYQLNVYNQQPAVQATQNNLNDLMRNVYGASGIAQFVGYQQNPFAIEQQPPAPRFTIRISDALETPSDVPEQVYKFRTHQKVKIINDYDIGLRGALAQIVHVYSDASYRVLIQNGSHTGNKYTIQEADLAAAYKRNLPSWF